MAPAGDSSRMPRPMLAITDDTILRVPTIPQRGNGPSTWLQRRDRAPASMQERAMTQPSLIRPTACWPSLAAADTDALRPAPRFRRSAAGKMGLCEAAIRARVFSFLMRTRFPPTGPRAGSPRDDRSRHDRPGRVDRDEERGGLKVGRGGEVGGLRREGRIVALGRQPSRFNQAPSVQVAGRGVGCRLEPHPPPWRADRGFAPLSSSMSRSSGAIAQQSAALMRLTN